MCHPPRACGGGLTAGGPGLEVLDALRYCKLGYMHAEREELSLAKCCEPLFLFRPSMMSGSRFQCSPKLSPISSRKKKRTLRTVCLSVIGINGDSCTISLFLSSTVACNLIQQVDFKSHHPCTVSLPGHGETKSHQRVISMPLSF